jgi:hypothetical protein
MGSAHGEFVDIKLIYGKESEKARRWNLLIFAEGYVKTDLGAGKPFDTDARALSTAIRGIFPLNEFPDAINVYRVDVSSKDPGAMDPARCGGTNATPDTYFDASYCGARSQRSFLTADYDAAVIMANDKLPEWDGLVILVNSIVPGGSARNQVAVCSKTGMTDYIAHELGHVFGLADEYVLWHDTFSGPEPAEINATLARTLADLDPLWAGQVAQGTPIPTKLNTTCKNQKKAKNPAAADGTIGTFEGAWEVSCGVFRPSTVCRMITPADSFCAVCAEAIREILRGHS